MKTRKAIRYFLVLFVLLMLAGCQMPNILPTDTPTPAPTFILECTKAIGFATSFPAQKTTQTSAAPTPTPDLFTYQRDAYEAYSPGGNYVAIVNIAQPFDEEGKQLGEAYHWQVKIINQQDGETWVALDRWQDLNGGLKSPVLLRWTNDERYLFFAEQAASEDCKPMHPQNLLRVDAVEHIVEEIPFQADAVSPDGGQLLFFSPQGLLFHNLATGEESELPLTLSETCTYAGDFTWSPSGALLLFSACINPCGDDEQASTVLLVKPEEQTSLIVAEDDPRGFRVRSFPMENLAQLEAQDGTTWWLYTDDNSISTSPPAEVEGAQQALSAFFEALAGKRYKQAIQWYGGSYDVLEGMNPETDPQDKAALWQAACERNGFMCMKLESMVLRHVPSGEGADSYEFEVTFQYEGQTFTLGPCCGADISEMPPQSVFHYRVLQYGGNFKVLDLPVYVP